MENEKTSKRIATIAAKGLNNPESLTPEEIRAVCGSAATQAADRKTETAPSAGDTLAKYELLADNVHEFLNSTAGASLNIHWRSILEGNIKEIEKK